MPLVGFDDYMARTENGLASFTIYAGVVQVGWGGADLRIFWFWF